MGGYYHRCKKMKEFICFCCNVRFRTKNKIQRFCSWNCRVNSWSRCYKNCINCGTNKIRYRGKGLCSNCYDKLPYIKLSNKFHRQTTEYKQKKKLWDKNYSQSKKGMLSHSKAIKRYITTDKGKLKYNDFLNKKVAHKDREKLYGFLITEKNLKHKEISFLEFGVGRGNSLKW